MGGQAEGEGASGPEQGGEEEEGARIHDRYTGWSRFY